MPAPKILIVDDEPENLDALELALQDENPDWLILKARDEHQAQEILRQQVADRESIDVVLTDLVMATDHGGMTLLEAAREIDPLVMSILFTAKERNLDRYKAFDYGAFDVVEKNIRGQSAAREINLKTRAALRYRAWSQRVNYLRRYFDPRLFATLERDPSLLDLKQRTITICFWDIRGFSKLCEILKEHPPLIAGFLREYSEEAAKAIFEHGGLLDKFIGDGVMALFGVLNHKDDNGKADALAAVQAARSLRDRFERLRADWLEQWALYSPQTIEIGLGCGIHTGEALVGNMGTDFRDQFTAVGPHVNLAARIESRTQHGQILLSQTTEARVSSEVRCSPKGSVDDIKNIPGEFKLFEVVG
jgi:adenylate cyclase